MSIANVAVFFKTRVRTHLLILLETTLVGISASVITTIIIILFIGGKL